MALVHSPSLGTTLASPPPLREGWAGLWAVELNQGSVFSTSLLLPPVGMSPHLPEPLGTCGGVLGGCTGLAALLAVTQGTLS